MQKIIKNHFNPGQNNPLIIIFWKLPKGFFNLWISTLIISVFSQIVFRNKLKFLPTYVLCHEEESTTTQQPPPPGLCRSLCLLHLTLQPLQIDMNQPNNAVNGGQGAANAGAGGNANALTNIFQGNIHPIFYLLPRKYPFELQSNLKRCDTSPGRQQ